MVSVAAPRWLHLSLFRSDGPPLVVAVKAWLYDARDVAYWELRRFIDAAAVRPVTQRLHCWLRERKTEFPSLFAKFGLQYDTMIRPSRKALLESERCSGETANHEFVRDEWSVHTVGLCLMLMHLAVCSRRIEHRASCARLLRAFLTGTCSPNVLDEVKVMSVPSHIASQCEVASENGLCEHVREVVGAASACDSPQASLAEALVQSLRLSTLASCQACRALAQQALTTVGSHVKKNLPELGHDDPTRSADFDPTNDRVKKRRRLDEDLTKAVTAGSGRDAKASSSRAFVKATGTASSSSAAYWEMQELLWLQAGAWEVMSSGGALHTALDGARIGNPAEETELIIAWSATAGKGCICPPQAIPDYRKEKPRGSNVDATEEEKQNHRFKLMTFMAEHTSMEEEARLKKMKAKLNRLANQYFVQAYDHGLLGGIGRGLDFFLAPRLLWPLETGAERYYIEPTDVVDQGVFAGGSTRRACVESPDGATRLEVPRILDNDGKPAGNSLHTACDRGSAQWPALYWLYHEMQGKRVRGFLWPDKWHKLWNLTKGALKNAGLGPFITELLLITNLNCGPWHGDAFFDVIKGSAQAMFRNSSCQHEVYQELYPKIAADFGMDSDLDYQSAGHIERVWGLLPDRPCFQRKGAKCKLSRFWALFDGLEEVRPDWHVKLLAMLDHGIGERWWPTVAQSPLHSLVCDFELEQPGERAAANDEGEPPRSVAQSNEMDWAKLKRQRKSLLHVVTGIMASPSKFSLSQLIVEVVSPLRAAFGDWVQRSKAEMGVTTLMWEWSQGSMNEVMVQTFQKLKDPECLQRVGFKSSLKQAPANNGEEIFSAENDMAMKMFRVIIHLLDALVVESMQNTHVPPGMFAKLLHQSSRPAALAELKKYWEVLLELEQLGQGDAWYRNFARNLCWPSLVQVRETLITLSEEKFLEVPQFLQSELRDAFRGLIFTKCVEDTFKVIRHTEKGTTNNKVSRQQRWRAAQKNDLLGEYGRASVSREDAGMTRLPSKLADTIFDADCRDNSLGMETVAHLSDTSWRSPNPANYDLVALATACAMRLDNLQDLRSVYLSLLFHPRMIAYNRSDQSERGLLVLGAHAWGLTVWPLLPRTLNGIPFFELVVPKTGEQPWMHIPIVDNIRSWWVMESKAVSPLDSLRLFNMSSSRGILLKPDGEKRSLLRAAAARGFSGMTVPQLQQLLGELHVPLAGPRPTVEIEVVTTLVRFVYPDAGPDDIKRMVSKRGSRLDVDKTVWSALLEGDNLEACRHLLDDDANDEMKKVRTAYEKQKAAKELRDFAPKPTAASSSSASGEGGSKSKDGERVLKLLAPSVMDAFKMTVAESKTLTPRVAGATLTVARDGRWVAKYPTDAPPRSNSKSFGENGVSQRGAMLSVLRWAWGRHQAATGEECPYDLSM